ncbi:T9SS type A sorting domain-containing protein [Candidatus Zixiibacteriota bacterium]
MNAWQKQYLRSFPVFLLIAGLAFGMITSTAADLEFITQDIGYPVQYFEPVDIEGDGIWELALQVWHDGNSVGVYSPFYSEWIDGPHPLFVHGYNWGCGDFDRKGTIEYVHFYEDTLLVYYPSENRDTALFTVDYVPQILQLWGCSGSNEPFIYLSCPYSHSTTCECSWPGYDCGSHSSRGEWRRYSITNASYLGTIRGPYTHKGTVCFLDSGGFSAFLCIPDQSMDIDDRCGETYYSCDLSLSLLAESSLLVLRTTVVDARGDCCEWPICYPGIEISHRAIRATDHESGYDIFYLAEYMSYPYWGYLEATKTSTAGTTWVVNLEREPYSGLAYFDWFGDSTGVLFISSTRRNLWEIRDPQTGAIIDSLPGLPPADIRTAPIMEPDVLDLYYFLDSTLYILNRPGMPVGIPAEENNPPIPEAFTLRQNYPNPFNASTVIKFELDQPGPVKLEVYNILGEKVAVLLNEHRPAGLHQAQWNGTDLDGRAVVSGIYFYRLASANKVETRKMVLLK